MARELQVMFSHRTARREDRLQMRSDTTRFTRSEYWLYEMYKCSILGHPALRAVAKVLSPSRDLGIVKLSIFSRRPRNTHASRSEIAPKSWSNVKSVRF